MNKLFRSIKEGFKVSPIGSLTTLCYLIYSSIIKAINVVLIANILDCGLEVINGSSPEDLIKNTIIYLVLYLIYQGFSYYYSIAMNGYLFEKSNFYFREKLNHKNANMRAIDFEDASILDMKKRAELAIDDEIVPLIVLRLFKIFSEILTVILVMLALIKFDYRFVIIGLISIIPFFIISLIRGKSFYQLKNIEARNERKLEYIFSLFTNIKTNREIKSTASHDFFRNRYKTERQELNKKFYRERFKDAASMMLCDMIRILGYATAMGFTIHLILKGELSVGGFGGAIYAFTSMQEACTFFLNRIGELPSELSYANDYFKYIDMDEEYIEHSVDFGDIKLNEIGFSYPNSEPIIDGLNLDIKEGETVAIVGLNGAGKTTLTKLVMGIYENDSGEITFNKKAVDRTNKLNRDDISIVSQNIYNYKLSIREMVALSNLDKIDDDAAIISALDSAGLTYLLDKYELNSRVGQEFGGIELSGGEMERLAIARAIFKDSSLYVLDEPTAAIDPIEESNLLKKILNISKGKTSIIVTHRLGICRSVDKVVLLKDGRIIESGSHDELINLKGDYYELYNKQAKFYN
ncbi:MAG: ABC transporter ATP-binding protein [Firmicutes bacterium]|nr:ABC transporter ATP-binding protein [Bacillota bacterium]